MPRERVKQDVCSHPRTGYLYPPNRLPLSRRGRRVKRTNGDKRMARCLLALLVGVAASGFLFPDQVYAQRYRRRGAAPVQRGPTSRVTSQQQYTRPVAPRTYRPTERVYTREGYNEYGERYFITTHDEGDWKYHEGVDTEGNSFTGDSFDWGSGYVSHDVRSINGKRYKGHSFDWGDGYSTYSFEDEEGNEIEFDSRDLELQNELDNW